MGNRRSSRYQYPEMNHVIIKQHIGIAFKLVLCSHSSTDLFFPALYHFNINFLSLPILHAKPVIVQLPLHIFRCFLCKLIVFYDGCCFLARRYSATHVYDYMLSQTDVREGNLLLRSFWNPSLTFWGPSGFLLGAFSYPAGILLKPSGVPLGSFWGLLKSLGVLLESFWGCCRVHLLDPSSGILLGFLSTPSGILLGFFLSRIHLSFLPGPSLIFLWWFPDSSVCYPLALLWSFSDPSSVLL